jgi:hypothetical protein
MPGQRDRGEDEVPRIGRGRILPRLDADGIIKILMLLLCLVAIVFMRRSCATGVTGMFNAVAPPVTPDARR